MVKRDTRSTASIYTTTKLISRKPSLLKRNAKRVDRVITPAKVRKSKTSYLYLSFKFLLKLSLRP